MTDINVLYEMIIKFYEVGMMNARPNSGFSSEEAEIIGELLGVDWKKSLFTIEDYRRGLEVELEHGIKDKTTNVTNNDPILTGKIALAHLKEFPDYYQRLTKLENEAKKYWKNTMPN